MTGKMFGEHAARGEVALKMDNHEDGGRTESGKATQGVGN